MIAASLRSCPVHVLVLSSRSFIEDFDYEIEAVYLRLL
jgi:hypothetical protein